MPMEDGSTRGRREAQGLTCERASPGTARAPGASRVRDRRRTGQASAQTRSTRSRRGVGVLELPVTTGRRGSGCAHRHFVLHNNTRGAIYRSAGQAKAAAGNERSLRTGACYSKMWWCTLGLFLV